MPAPVSNRHGTHRAILTAPHPLQDQGSGPQRSVSDAVYVYRDPTCTNKQGVPQTPAPTPPAVPVPIPAKVQNAADQVSGAYGMR